jgi:hypothetical protein
MQEIQRTGPGRYSLRSSVHGAALFGLLLALNTPAPAAIYRCIDADGTSTFSDHECQPKTAPGAQTPAAGGAPVSEARPDTPQEKKAAHILDLLRIAPLEPEGVLLRQTVDDAAPDLVKGLDPDNPSWSPASPRWHPVSEFVKSDLRRDVQTALRASTAQVAQSAARVYAGRTSDADMEAVSAYLKSSDGGRYIAFQNELRSVLYSTIASIEAQDPVTSEPPADKELRQRRQLLHLALDYRIAKDGGGPPAKDLHPGSETVLENAVRREGTALDSIFWGYESFLPSFEAFTAAAGTKRFFTAVEPAMRTELALSSTATTDFAEQEFDRYFTRWRAYYGPAVWVSTRNTILIRGRTVFVSHVTTTRSVSPPGSVSAENMALQCEQRETNLYQATHRTADYNARSAALKSIQNRCRAEQHLPAL